MIYLIDPCNDPCGHSVIYRNSLSKIGNTKYLDCPVDLKKVKSPIRMIFKYYIALREQLECVPKGNSAHLLYGDLYYKIPFVCSKLLKRNKILVTMHTFPNGKLKHFLLKNFCKRVERVIVHSEHIKRGMNAIGIKNVTHIDYPSFYNYAELPSKNELRFQLNIPQDKIIFSALGGIRNDKGLDILLEAFRYMSQEIKARIILNVAGKPGFLGLHDIEALCNRYNIHSRLDIRPLTEKEFMENVIISDYMVMPYRKNMTGNSGPMTEAIVNKIPCIVPMSSNLGAIARQHNIGVCFKQEDPKDLAATIEKVLQTPHTFDFSYSQKLKESSFIENHKQLYRSLGLL